MQTIEEVMRAVRSKIATSAQQNFPTRSARIMSALNEIFAVMAIADLNREEERFVFDSLNEIHEVINKDVEERKALNGV